MTHPKHLTFQSALALLLLMTSAVATALTPDEGSRLFHLGPPDATRERPAQVRAIYAVEMAAEVLAQRAVSDTLVLPLPNGLTLPVQRWSSANREGSDFTWHGRTQDGTEDWAQLVLTHAGSQTYATIRTRRGVFQIRPRPEGGHVLMEFEASGRRCAVDDEHSEPAYLPEEGNGRENRPESTVIHRGGGPRTLDIFVVYTPVAKFETLGLIELAIQNAIDDANAAFSASSDEGVVAQLNLVGTAELNYISAGNFSNDLDMLTVNPVVANLRDAAAADLVAMIVESTFAEYCGIAWRMQRPSVAFERLAFSVTAADCLHDLTLAHEVGHNLGLHHNVESAENPAYFEWSYGYYFDDFLSGFRTVMSYGDCDFCPGIGNFSNPGINFNGRPTGTVLRDNHHTMQSADGEGTVPIAAHFRISPNDDDRYEPNNTRADATDISTSSYTLLSSLRGDGIQKDEDWYRIQVPSGRLFVTAELTFEHASGDIDLELTDINGNRIAVSQSITDNESIATVVPAPGTYFLRVYYGNAGNAYDLFWDARPPAPDLTVENVGANPGAIAIPFNPFLIDATVVNRGVGDSTASTIRFYRSSNPLISTSDELLDSEPVPPMFSGGTSPESTFTTVPSAIGTYWYGACVDPIPGEDLTSNNCSAGVAVRVGPDLTPRNVSATPGIIAPGDTYTFTAEIHNIGGTASGENTSVNFRYSSTPGVTPGDAFAAIQVIGSVPRGDFAALTQSVEAPTEPGTYWPGVCVLAVTGELDVANQCQSGAPFVVSSDVVFINGFE